MMRSEFIERTGFEPTAAEYEQIEQEYMGTDIDKDQFCKQWVKQGGIQRISRQRVRRIGKGRGKRHEYRNAGKDSGHRTTGNGGPDR